ncbi:TetR/AcrR family transcriptional regulator [Flavobacterium sp. AJR]|uniref:TetR/AcrR family transcriptional regulator n=1 Tax=Flavobacterium sp. AJR TaxID=1979369 RepID=UPI000A3D88C5|nr:TetR/AcrR family transcriptional regulator [Flavobacterium sp. AJR]OUL61971.1 hypothetical protein B8T70_12390 [Flavobacterium sp. AJR]
MSRNKQFNPVEKLVKARDLFWKKGYHVTSIQDLVDQMQVNRRSMYDTYGDKHELFIQSLESYAIETYGEFNSIAQLEKSPKKAIEGIISKAIERSFEKEKICMIVKSSFELAPLDQSMRDLLRQHTQRLIIIFQNLIIKAQEAGEISTEKNALKSAQFIVGSFAGLWQMQSLFNDRIMVEAMAERILESLK